jgi:CDP-diacylglycerol--glycerol-3-phosphate 3-phosphatidyltransferase
MNLPNRLTIVRIALIPVFITLFFLPFPFLKFAALGVFFIAAFTDFLDGYIARKYNIVTEVGNFLDTIADKMLVVCALVAIVADFALSAVVNDITSFSMVILLAVSAMIIVVRELLISALKMISKIKGVTVVADKLGKVKMFLQIVALFVLIPYTDCAILNPLFGDIVLYSGVGLLLAATILALISAVNYLVKYRFVFSEIKEPEENKQNESKCRGGADENSDGGKEKNG